MYQIGSPFGKVFGLKSILTFSVSTLVLTKYAILGFEPPLVLDFDESYFRTEGTATDLVSAATHTRAGNATMVDSDGVLKWGPHNEIRQTNFASGWIAYSSSISASGVLTETGTSNFQTVYQPGSSGVYTRTLKCHFTPINRDFAVLSIGPTAANWAAATFDLANGVVTKTQGSGSGTLVSSSILADGDGYMCEITVSGISASYYYIGASDTGTTAYASYGLPTYLGNGLPAFSASTPHLYRSDLGGMVDNPATGDSYVPTTSAARYLPRVGHHIWNGSAWVNEGYFHESEARANLVTYSNDFTDASWVEAGVSVTANDATSPDGTTNADYLSIGGGGYIQQNFTHTIGQQYTISAWVKSYDGTDELFRLYGEDTTVSGDFTATNEWQRFSYTYTATKTTGGDGITRPSTLVPTLLHVYGAQVEAGSTPSSYNPTAGATVTRAADIMTIPAANLPWPEPVVIGPELVTNGTFDTDTDWIKTGATAITAGVATLDGTSGIGLLYQNILTLGETYFCSFTISAITGTLLVINNDGTVLASYTTTGTKTLSWTHGIASGNFIFRASTGSNTASLDNVSVKETNPLAVSIQMEGTMTYADTDNSMEISYADWALDSTNYIRQVLSTVGSRIGALNFAQRENTSGLDSIQSASNTYSPGVNVPFNIASRHGSTFINGAVDGTALTANLTPTALPYLENTDMQIGSTFNGTIKLVRVWADDLTDEGIEEGSSNV